MDYTRQCTDGSMTRFPIGLKGVKKTEKNTLDRAALALRFAAERLQSLVDVRPGTPGSIRPRGPPMKTLLFAVSLAATLIALPVAAQQGPAGVPGAPGLAPPPPPHPAPAPIAVAPPAPVAQVKPRPRRPADCRKADDVEHCQARQEARRKARETCPGKAGSQRQHCLETRAADCRSESDPARCERFRKARELCTPLLGREHQQCLRDNLTAKK